MWGEIVMNPAHLYYQIYLCLSKMIALHQNVNTLTVLTLR